MQIKDSMECAKSELDLFSVPPTNTAIEEGHWDNIQPHPNFDQSPVIRYDITGTNSHYIDLAATELHVKFIIYTSKAEKLAPVDNVGLANNFLHSMFEQCQVYLNNVAVENTNKCYAYRSYLENLLCYNNDAKENLLRGDFFFPETVKNVDFKDTNTKYLKTQHLINKGQVGTSPNKVNDKADALEAYGKIHCDIFNINKYMLNNIDIKLVFTRSSDSFCLFAAAGTECTVSIQDTFLRIRRVKISNAVMLAHAMALEQTTAKYPIKRVLVKPFVIANSSSIFTISGIHFGIMPTRVVVGFVKTSAYGGTLEHDPFYFDHIGATYLNLKVASRSLPYAQGIHMSYYKKNYTQAYMTFHKNIREASHGISYENYAKGNT